jgi:hypothetical protein
MQSACRSGQKQQDEQDEQDEQDMQCIDYVGLD